MAKSNRQVYKVPQPKMPKASQLEPPKPSGPVLPEQNQLCFGVFWGSLSLGLIVNAVLIYFISHNALLAYRQQPVNWLAAVLYTVLLVLAVGLLRAVVWGAFVLSATVAARTQSFTAQTVICQWARKFRHFLPGGASWATQAIMQRLITNGQYAEAITLGNSEYETIARKNPKDQSLANICACIGISYQLQGEQHRSIEWNEKASQAYEDLFASMAKSGGINKFAGQSLGNVMDTLYLQYAQVLVGLGTAYLSVNNRMKAKEHLKNALQQARKAPDSDNRRDIIRACEEHLSRLKHF